MVVGAAYAVVGAIVVAGTTPMDVDILKATADSERLKKRYSHHKER